MSYLTFCSGFLPLTLYLVYRRHLLIGDIQFIKPFIWLTAGLSLYQLIFTLYYGIDLALGLYLYPLIEFIVLFYFFYNVMSGEYRLLFYLFIGIFLTGCLFFIFTDTIVVGRIKLTYNTFILLFIFTFGLLWPMHLLNGPQKPPLETKASFWFLTGILFYHCCTFAGSTLNATIGVNAEVLAIGATPVLNLFLMMSVWRSRLS